MLIIGAGDKDFTLSYVPPVHVPGSVHGTATTFGNTTYLDAYQNPGYTMGGYAVPKPIAKYGAVLIDAENGQTIWMADALSRGNAFADFNDLAASMARKAVCQLFRDGIFSGKCVQPAPASSEYPQ